MPGFANKDVTTLQKVVNKVKYNKLDFEYGKLNSEINDKNSSIKIFFPDSPSIPITPYKGYISTDLIVGLAEYKNYLIVKAINPKHNEDIIYIIFTKDKFYIKEKFPFITEETLYIHGLLLDWSNGEETTKSAHKILKLNLNEYRKCPKIIYRGLILRDIAIERLRNNKSVKLSSKYKFSSWSMDKKYAAVFSNGIIMKYSPKDEVVINVELFEKKVFKTLDYWPYPFQEEIILLNSPSILVLKPDQIIFKDLSMEAIWS